MPILFANCNAAPSARGPCGTGRVNDVWIMPSPVVSPYGRTCRFSVTWPLLQQVDGRVAVAVGFLDHAVRALPAGRRAFHQAERAVGDRVEQPAVDDPRQQVHRLAEDLVGPF